MERTQPGEDVCALVRGDGLFHIEKLFPAKTDIFEGLLSASELQDLLRMVDDETLLHLTQEKISEPLASHGLDVLSLAVLRPGHWQYLSFPTMESRHPYESTLDPFLRWLDTLAKQKHTNLKEDEARVNCMPPGDVQLKTRPTARTSSNESGRPGSSAPPAAGPKYLLRLREDSFSGREFDRSCAIVYPDGRYHLEKKAQKIREKNVKTEIFEDTISSTGIDNLKAILDSPNFVNRKPEDLPGDIAIMEGDMIFLAIPRSGVLQKLYFWRYYSAAHIGGGGLPVTDNHGMKQFQPLRDWMKVNLNPSEAPLQGIPSTDCAPSTP